MFSVTDKNSYSDIQGFVKQILRVKDKDVFPMVLIGNKQDMEGERQVQASEAKEYAKGLGLQYVETSAKLRINVDVAFYECVREIRKYYKNSAPAKLKGKKGGGCALL